MKHKVSMHIFTVLLCSIACSDHPLEAKNGGAIAAGILGGALIGSTIATANSCASDDPNCIVYAGPPVVYGNPFYGPYYYPYGPYRRPYYGYYGW